MLSQGEKTCQRSDIYSGNGTLDLTKQRAYNEKILKSTQKQTNTKTPHAHIYHSQPNVCDELLPQTNTYKYSKWPTYLEISHALIKHVCVLNICL